MDLYCASTSESLAGSFRVKLLKSIQFYAFEYKDFLRLNLTVNDTFEFCSLSTVLQYKSCLSHIIYDINVSSECFFTTLVEGMNLGEESLKMRWTKVLCNSYLYSEHQTL